MRWAFFVFHLTNCHSSRIITVLYNDVIRRGPMEEKSTVTLKKIQEAAMAEFLDKGFQGASLRQIVKNAGVTTGAFYGYFSSKEAPLCLHRGATCGRFDGAVHGGADFLFRTAGAGTAGAHGAGVQPVRELDGGLYLRPPGAGEAAAVQGRGHQLYSSSSTLAWQSPST